MPRRPVVIVAEDQGGLGRLIRDAFVADGYEVETAQSLAEAARALRRGGADLLISDVEDPPGGSPDELDAMCREFPKLPVVAVRNRTPDNTPVFGPWRVEGHVLTLPRPYRLEDLLAAARTVLA